MIIIRLWCIRHHKSRIIYDGISFYSGKYATCRFTLCYLFSCLWLQENYFLLLSVMKVHKLHWTFHNNERKKLIPTSRLKNHVNRNWFIKSLAEMEIMEQLKGWITISEWSKDEKILCATEMDGVNIMKTESFDMKSRSKKRKRRQF